MTTTRDILYFLKKNNLAEYRALLELRTKQPDKFNEKIENWDDVIGKDDSLLFKNELEFPEELNNKSLHYLEGFHNWEECKLLSDKCLKERNKFMVFVSKGNIFKGRFVNEILPYQQEIKIATLCNFISKDGNADLLKTIHFLDSKQDKRRYNQEDIIEKKFWIYQFESNHREYVVLSEEQQVLENCILEGTLIKLEDEFKIGESKTLDKTLPLILLHSVTTSKPVFKSHKELISKTKEINLNHENYFDWLFSKSGCTYDHPDYFQYLISSFLLSAKDKFPLHLLLMAKAGTGKSTVEECIHEKFDETNAILEGSISTMKALIPSFKGVLPDSGALLKSNRISIVDEFLRILMRVDHNDRESQLASLNPILEHKDRDVCSGNGNMKAHPTARALFVSNCIWGSGTMEGLAEHIDNSFLSRLLIWYLDRKHINFINDRKNQETKSKYSIEQDLWLGIVDYLHSFKAEWDKTRLNEIVSKGLLLLGDDSQDNIMSKVRDVYIARCGHHANCLLDGIIKTRCICTQDSKFKAIDKDYKTLEKLWFRMLIEWGIVANDIETSSLHSQIYRKVGEDS